MSEPQLSTPLFGRIAFVFAWYDCWIGIYWNRQKRWLYILPLPMIGIRIDCNSITGEEEG